MEISKRERELQSDIAAIQQIPIISTILDVVCRTTGMGFAAISRVTEERWITCSINDQINFGLKPGDELQVKTTICDEIRQSHEAVVIDDVDKDENFCGHHTPAMYGFKSYISVPIIRKNGSFFGTLCAIDPKPALLNNPKIRGMFNLFSDLIAFHLNVVEQLESSESKLVEERQQGTIVLEQKNAELKKINTELESFAYIASHDLQEPLRKIETFSKLMLDREFETLSAKGKDYLGRLNKSVQRMQNLIKDLIMYTQVTAHETLFQDIELKDIIEEVTDVLREEIMQKKAHIQYGELCRLNVIPFQFRQLLLNIISNSIKFSSPATDPLIEITCQVEKGSVEISERLSEEEDYCHLTISDNGIGFDPKFSQKIFEVFQRLHGNDEYDGTGIGLSIVNKIVDNHNGFITAAGNVDKGARFDIYLPLHQPESKQHGLSAEP